MPPTDTANRTAADRSGADVGALLAGPMAVQMGTLRVMAEANRTIAGLWPAAWLVASSPFFWAPPLWVLAMMAGSTADPKGGVAGSTASGRR